MRHLRCRNPGQENGRRATVRTHQTEVAWSRVTECPPPSGRTGRGKCPIGRRRTGTPPEPQPPAAQPRPPSIVSRAAVVMLWPKSIRAKLIRILVVSLALVLVLLGFLVTNETTNYQTANQTSQVVTIALRVQDAVQQLQKERALTNGLLGGGTQFQAADRAAARADRRGARRAQPDHRRRRRLHRGCRPGARRAAKLSGLTDRSGPNVDQQPRPGRPDVHLLHRRDQRAEHPRPRSRPGAGRLTAARPAGPLRAG